jgi:hypothetical protein
MKFKDLTGGVFVLAMLFGAMVSITSVVRAQVVDLIGLGIEADFESPDADPANDGAEQTVARNLGPGWSFNLLGGGSSDFGVQDPADGYYGAHPLTAPFSGRQVGYFNLEPFSAGEALSDSVGTLTAGQTLMLNVAVGARNNATWSNQRYAVGLRTMDGVSLGTFATTDLDPGSSASVKSDLTYTLNVDAEAASHIGSDVRVVIRGINLGVVNPVPTPNVPAFSQANFDNVRLNGTLGAPNQPILTINRSSGVVTLNKTGATNMSIAGYSITSAAGALNSNPANWLSIANNYDKNSGDTPGNGSVDANDAWSIFSPAGSKTNLAEGELELESGADGGTLSNSNINLGNVWRQTPLQDVTASVTLDNGSTMTAHVVYTGNAIPIGDLTSDGNINGLDWTAFKNGQGTNFTGLTAVERYLAGDLDADQDHDLSDFIRFRVAYDALNGSGAFAEMLASVPEPCTAVILGISGLLGGVSLRRRSKSLRKATIDMPTFSTKRGLIVGIVTLCGSLMSQTSSAQTLVSHWSFNSSTQTINAGNITGFAEQTGNHNAAPGGPTGGASGVANTSAAFPVATSSVPGQFGEAVQFAGNNFLSFPNLTELMQASGGPSWSVSMWFKTATNGGGFGSPYSTLGNWGNESIANSDAADKTRFTYGFGPNQAARFRAQARRFNAASGNNGTDGSDIIARDVVVTTPINNGNWHMMTWTFNTSNGQLLSYYDNVLVDTFTSTAPSFVMADSSSTIGVMGLKADSSTFAPAGVMLDEIWVYNGILNSGHVGNLFNCNDITGNSCTPTKLRVNINTATGNIELENPTDAPISFNGYQIVSPGNSLDSAGWNGISEQTISGFPVGNGSGNGWEAGPNSDANELTEWRLVGDSTLAPGQTIDLGAAYNEAVGLEDLQFFYSSDTNTLFNGHIRYIDEAGGVPGDYNGNGSVDAADYVVWRNGGPLSNEVDTPGTVNAADYTEWRARFGNSASGSGLGDTSAVPEPTTGLLLTFVAGLLLAARSRPRFALAAMPTGRSFLLLAGVIVLAGSNGSASAAYTVDRLYQFGDDSGEDAANALNDPDGVGPIGGDVGTGPANIGAGDDTLDTIGPSGAFVDLASNGANGKPKYIDVSVTSADLLQVRPGAPSGNRGVLFDGVDDYLSGLRFNNPSTAPGTVQYTTPGPNNYNGVLTRGMQLWVYPNSASSTVNQWIVRDTQQHGMGINNQGEWQLSYGNTTVDSNVDVVFNQWYHVMVAMPGTLPNREVLYIDGVAIAARQANYANGTDFSLVVGADTGNTTSSNGDSDRFRGVVDELEMFVWGNVFDVNTGTITPLGQFDFATDNEYADTLLTDIAGDVDQNGTFEQADIDVFVENWLSEKVVNGVRVGDMSTIENGDLNFDGITDLLDMALLRGAISGSGSGASFDLTALNQLGVPEPSALAFAALSLTALLSMRRRGRRPEW